MTRMNWDRAKEPNGMERPVSLRLSKKAMRKANKIEAKRKKDGKKKWRSPVNKPLLTNYVAEKKAKVVAAVEEWSLTHDVVLVSWDGEKKYSYNPENLAKQLQMSVETLLIRAKEGFTDMVNNQRAFITMV